MVLIKTCFLDPVTFRLSPFTVAFRLSPFSTFLNDWLVAPFDYVSDIHRAGAPDLAVERCLRSCCRMPPRPGLQRDRHRRGQGSLWLP